MMIFPVEYPELPPNGFYIQSNATAPANHGHIYTRAYNEGFGSIAEEQDMLNRNGWARYCAHAGSGSRQTAKLKRISDWHAGENLFAFFP
jgi:hypothetical protein